jgi:hypothetical protein
MRFILTSLFIGSLGISLGYAESVKITGLGIYNSSTYVSSTNKEVVKKDLQGIPDLAFEISHNATSTVKGTVTIGVFCTSERWGNSWPQYPNYSQEIKEVEFTQNTPKLIRGFQLINGINAFNDKNEKPIKRVRVVVTLTVGSESSSKQSDFVYHREHD